MPSTLRWLTGGPAFVRVALLLLALVGVGMVSVVSGSTAVSLSQVGHGLGLREENNAEEEDSCFHGFAPFLERVTIMTVAL